MTTLLSFLVLVDLTASMIDFRLGDRSADMSVDGGDRSALVRRRRMLEYEQSSNYYYVKTLMNWHDAEKYCNDAWGTNLGNNR